jgi:hypothetical protein
LAPSDADFLFGFTWSANSVCCFYGALFVFFSFYVFQYKLKYNPGHRRPNWAAVARLDGVVVWSIWTNGREESFNSDNFTLAHAAAAVGDLAALRALVAADPAIAHRPNRNKRTPLHIAATNGRLECTAFLISLAAKTQAGFECILWCFIRVFIFGVFSLFRLFNVF